MMIWCFISVYFLVNYSAASEDCYPRLICNNTHVNGKVEDFCTTVDGRMNGKCCIANETVVGLDLRYCGIERLNISDSGFTNLTILDLEDNEFEKFTKEDLVGFTKLDFLFLPAPIKCPGGKRAWNMTLYDHNITTCSFQQNPCIYLNISCTENGICEHIGPGSAKCVCQPGHYGYKCLNEGEFPFVTFLSSVIVPTIVMAIILWFVQGRDAYRKS